MTDVNAHPVAGASVRDRMIVGAAELLGRAGVAEASLRNVVALTGSPRGSIYHHFPGGKDEMVAAAMREVGRRLLAELDRSSFTSAAEVVVTFAGLFRRLVEVQQGCAVAAVASAAEPEAPTREVAGQVFAAWRRQVTATFTTTGMPEADAGDMAALTVAAVEGAIVVARAAGDLAEFDRVIEALLARLG